MLYWLNHWMKQLLKREIELRLKHGLRFGSLRISISNPHLSLVSGCSRFMMCLYSDVILFKNPMLCMQVCSYLPNHLSVKLGGSLLSYLRGLSVPLMEYFLCKSHVFCLLFVNIMITVQLFICFYRFGESGGKVI